ncbi:MAG: hypothetical protein KME17_03525 [Cyanosarcina radialis HA8281-LM2]|jgi:uncharacterized small protein (DUF1192 family)|nr:hypothetical protein [Cyanosarcina radialis HA8281-LM2]
MDSLLQKISDRFKYQICRQTDVEKQKIFVIGLAKTGTSSITDALKILGFRSIHWPPIGRLAAEDLLEFYWPWWLNKFEAFSDVPVTQFFVELDRRFPNALFIQTIRDRDSWLKSCRKHFAVGSTEKKYELVRAIHQSLYGANIFEEKTFTAAYDRHMATVKEYFQDRSDFITLDVCSGEGWDKLCSFLNKDVPELPFPHQNQNPDLVLTSAGIEKLRAAIRQAEIGEQAIEPLMLAELSQRIGLHSQTIADILEGKIAKDKRTMRVCFSAFKQDLKEEDYTVVSPLSPSPRQF